MTELSSQYLSVAMPLIALLGLEIWFVRYLQRRDGQAPVDDFGAWYSVAVTAYGALPLASFLALRLQYTPLNDLRLYLMQPVPKEVGEIGWYYVIHLAAFVFAYVRSGANILTDMRRAPLRRVSKSMIVAIVILFLGSMSVELAIWQFYGVGGRGYTETYLAIQNLPLIVRQLNKVANGATFVFHLAVLVFLFNSYVRSRWLIAAWLAFELFVTVATHGSRSALVLQFASAAILYHVRVRPIRMRWAVLFGGTALAGFLAIGLIRALQGTQGFGAAAGGLSMGEFESLFGNALDVARHRAQGDLPDPPLGFYVADLVSPIPSQMLPFEKVDPSDWYLGTFYPEVKAAGAGLALGVVAQSILGAGWIEVLIRGLLAGLVFAWIRRLYLKNADRFWVMTSYVWLVLIGTVSFRVTSFYFFGLAVQLLLPSILLAYVASALISGALKAPRYAPLATPTLSSGPT